MNKNYILIDIIQLTANSGNPKKTILMDFGIHAREWISPATGGYIINEVNQVNIVFRIVEFLFNSSS